MTNGNDRTGTGKNPGTGAGEDTRDYFLRLFDDFPNLIWRAGLDARCDYFNRAWLAFTGRTSEQELGEGWLAGVHPDDLERCRAISRDAFLCRQPFEREYRLRYHDGSYRWLLDSGKPFFDPDGAFAGFIGSCYDIDDRKREQDAVQAAVRLNELIDTLSVGECMSVTVDEAERLTASGIGFFHFVNDDEKTIRLVAWSTETKKHCFVPAEPDRDYPVENGGIWLDCMRERRPVVHNDYAARPGKKGLPAGHVPLTRELVVPVFDGTKIVAIIGVGNKAGDYTGLDINILSLLAKNTWTLIRRKRTEEALRESEKRYRDMFEINNAVMLLIDPETYRIVDANAAACRFYGYSRDEMQHLLITQINTSDPEKTRKDMAFTAANRGAVFQFRHKKKNGEIRDVQVFSGEVYFGGRRLLHSIVQDVTDQVQARVALDESAKQYRELVENLSEVIISLDSRGIFLYVSPVVERQFGYLPDDLLGRDYMQFIHPDDRDRAAGLFGQELSGNYASYELRVIARDGSAHWVSISPRPILKGGTVAGVNYIMADITDRKNAEDEERVTRERFETLVKVAEMQDAGEQELSEFVMQAACRMTGSPLAFIGTMTPDELVMDLISWSASVMSDCRVTISPLHFPVNKAGIWADAVRERRPKIVNDYCADHPGKKGLPKGHVKIVRFLSLPIIENGKIVMIAAVANKQSPYKDVDVTRLTLLMRGVWGNISKRRSEEALKKSEALLNETGRLARIGGWEIDTATKGIVLTAGTYHIIGIPEDEMPDVETAAGYFDLPGRDALNAALDRCGKTGEAFDLELLLTTRTGRHIWTRVLGRGVRKGNTTVKLTGTIQDITDRRKAEDALKTINRKLTLLSSITRHDIKNQLLALKAYLELSREVLNDTAKLSEFITKEETAAKAIERQIAFTKEYEDLGINAPVWQSAAACVEDALPDLPVGKIAIRVELGAVEIYADPLLGKVFYNLIDNALKYGGPTMTTIRISCKNYGTGLTIVIEDDGEGISAGDKKRLFERGFGHNTGLGLFLSREILSITGIAITETGEPGKGARFEIALPEGGYRDAGT